eukprot:403348268
MSWLLIILSNSFTKSSFSNGHAVLDIIGVPRVKISDVSFSDILDATKESLSYFNQEISASSDDKSLSEIYSSSTSPISIDKFGVGMIKVQYVSYLYASGLTSTSNALIETSYSSSRALLLYVDGVYGQVELGKQTVTNHLGFYQLTENDKDYTDFTSNKEWGSYEVSNMQVGAKYTVYNSTLKDGTFLPINKITTNRCLVSSSIDLSDSSYQYIMLQHHDSNDQAYIIDAMTQNGREYEFESFTMINTFLNDTDLSDNYFLNKVECLGCTYPLFRLSAKTIDIQYANFSSIGEFYSSEDNKSKYYINAPVFKIYMRQPFKKQIDTDWTVEKVSFTDININSCYGYYDFHFFDIEQYTNFKDPLGNDITSYDFDISSDEQLIFGYDVNNTAKNIYTLGNGAFAYINLPDMKMSISSFQIESVQANYQNELQSIGGSFLFLEHLVKLTMVDVMGQDFEVQKNSSNLLTEGALIYYNDDAPFELDMSLERYNQDLGGLNCSRTQDGTNSISSTILSVTKASMIYLNGIDSKITLNVDTYSFGYCIGSEYGGVFRIESSVQNDVTISDAVFNANSAMKGGDIYCKNCYLSLSGIQSEDGKANEGGSMYLDKPVNSNFMWSSFIFEDMEAFNYGGSIYINSEESDQDFVITFDSLQVINSWEYGSKAGIDGGLMYLNIKRNLDITFDNCTLDGTQAGQNGGGFQLDQSTDGTLDLTISNSVIKKSKSGTDNSLATGHGGFVYTGDDISETTVTITNTTFTDCQASSNGNGGTFYLGGYNTNTISISSSSSFEMTSFASMQTQNGGIFYILGTYAIVTSDNTNYNGQFKANTGGLFYMGASNTNTLTISNAVIQNVSNSIYYSASSPSMGGFAYFLGKSSQLNISSGVTFSYMNYDYGAIVYFEMDNMASNNVIKLDILGAIFSNIYGYLGSIVYLSEYVNTATINILNDVSITAFGEENPSETFEGTFLYLGSDNIDLTLNITGLSLNCLDVSNTTSSLTTSNAFQTLTSGYYSKGSLFKLQPDTRATITTISIKISQCYTFSTYAMFEIYPYITYSDTGSLFSNISSNIGIFKLSGGQFSLDTTSFISTYANYGSVIYQKVVSDFFIEKCYFYQTYANLKGGVFYISPNIPASQTIEILNSTFLQGYAQQQGGVMFINNSMANLTFESNKITKYYNSQQGGVIYNQDALSIDFSFNTVTDCIASQYGSVIYSNKATPILLEENVITYEEVGTSLGTDNQGQPQTLLTYLENQLMNITISFNKSAMFYLASSNVTSKNNQFKNSYISMYGGVFYFTGSSLTDTGSIYYQVCALNGSALFCDNCQNLTFISPTFTSLYGGSGSVFYIYTSMDSYITLQDVTAYDLYSLETNAFLYAKPNTLGGMLSQDPIINVQMTGQSTNLENIYSSKDAGVFYLSGARTTLSIDLVSPTQTHFSNITSYQGGLIRAENILQISLSNIQAITSTIPEQSQQQQGGGQSSSQVFGGHFIYADSINTTITLSNNILKCDLLNYEEAISYPPDATEKDVQRRNNSISNCYTSKYGGALYLKNLQFFDTNTTYNYNNAKYGGQMYMSKVYGTITNAIFMNGYANDGGNIYMENLISLVFDNLIVLSATAQNGGFMYASAYISMDAMVNDQLQIVQFINEAAFSGLTASKSGGAFYLNSYYMQMYMNTKVTLSNVKATGEKGGIFYIKNTQKLEMTNNESTFQNIEALTSGSFITAESISNSQFQLTLQNLDINCQNSTATYTRQSDTNLNYNSGQTNQQSYGAIYLSGSNIIANFENNTVSMCNYIRVFGGAISGENAQITDLNSKYYYNSAQYGGAIYCKACILDISSLYFSGNSGGRGGSIALIDSTSGYSFEDFQIYNSYSVNDGAAIYISNSLTTTTWTLLISNLIASTIQGKGNGGVLYINDGFIILNFDTPTIESVIADKGGLIYNENSDSMTIDTGKFTQFQSLAAVSSVIHNAKTGYKQITIQDTEINCLTTAFDPTTTPFTETEGSAIYALDVMVFISTSNTIINCYNVKNGGVYFFESTTNKIDFTDQDSTYIGNQATNGGIVYSSGETTEFNQSVALKFTTANFTGNYATYGCIFNAQETVIIDVESATISGNTATGALILYLSGTTTLNSNADKVFRSSITLKSMTVTKNTAGILNNMESGGFIYVSHPYLSSLTITDITLTNNSVAGVANGGFLYIDQIYQDAEVILNTNLRDQNLFYDIYSNTKGQFIYASEVDFSLTITDTVVQCWASGTQLPGGGAIYFSSSATDFSEMNMTNTDISYCYTNTSGGALYVSHVNAIIQNTVIEYNVATVAGGAIYCTHCKLQVNSSEMDNNIAQTGGMLMIDNYHQIYIDSSSITYNQASQTGGAISIINSDSTIDTVSFLQISNCPYLSWNSAGSQGGFLGVLSLISSITISDSSLTGNYAQTSSNSTKSYGGIFYIELMNQMEMTGLSLTDSSADVGALLYSMSASDFYMSQITVVCNSSLDMQDVYDQLNSTSALNYYSSAFYFLIASNITSEYNSFSQCAVADRGGVFQLDASVFTDSKSIYQYNAAINGGVFSISEQESIVSIQDSEFYYNYAHKGGVFILTEKSYTIFNSLSIQYNQGFSSAGVLFVTTEAYFEMLACDILENQANQTSFLEVLQSSTAKNITIINTLIQKNKAIKNTVSLMYANVYIFKSTFDRNIATERTKNIFVGFSSLYIMNSNFKDYTYSNMTSQALKENTLGAFLFVTFDAKVYLRKCNFYNGVTYQGGAIYLSGKAEVEMLNSELKNNYAATYGGGVYAEGFSSFRVAETSTIANNRGLQSGDDFYMTNSDYTFEVEETTFTNPNATTSIYANSISLKLNKATFSEIANVGGSSEFGAAIQCIDCNKLNISNSLFNKCKSQKGGSVYIQESENNKNVSQKEVSYYLINSTFNNSQAYQGGSLYLDNIQNMTIANTKFNNSKASNSTLDTETYGIGGAIYYTCNEYNLNCQLNINNKSSFQNCSAEVKGGGIFWDVLEPKSSTDLTFKNNYAYLYGNDKACFAQKLASVTQAQYQAHLIKLGIMSADDITLRQLQSSSLTVSKNMSDVQSGGVIPTTYLAHVDQYDQIVGDDFNSKVRVQVDATYSADTKAKYSAIIEGTSSFTSMAGVVQIEDVTFAASPGYTYRISFSTDGIDQTKVANKAYKTEQKISDIDFKLTLALRNCSVGEYFTTAGKCIQCPNETSFSLVQMKEPGDCTECPTEKAVCNGGSNIGPKPGYWRKNNYTSTFVKCLNTAACLGMIAPDYDPQGSCYDGYQSILCADCVPGYSRSSDYKCAECPDAFLNVLRLGAILIFAVGLVVFMIRSTLSGAKDKNNVTSIYVKILMNHIQLIVLTASFKFDWPDSVKDLFDSAKPIASASTQVISVDCFLAAKVASKDSLSYASTEVKQDTSPTRIFYYKLVMLALMPFIVASFAFGFWFVYQCIRGKKRVGKVGGKAMSTLVIVLFLIHPSIVQYMFFNFKCIDVDEDSRVQDDLEIVCWTSAHKLYSLFVAVPSMIVWGLGIPFFAFLLLTKVRLILDKIESRERLGFLYRGYRKQFYFWEIIIMYRKIALIFISVFVSTYGVIAQALIVFILLIVFLFFNIKKQPFQTLALNDLETLSLLTSMITIYCGLFFVSSMPQEYIDELPDLGEGALQLDENTKLFFFSMIMISNITFFSFFGMKMYQEVKQKFRAKASKLYMILCLCGNRQKLQDELDQHKLAEENEFLREEYFKIIEQIKKVYYEGDLILSSHSIEKVMIYLDPKNLKNLAGFDKKIEKDILEKIDKRQQRDIINQRKRDKLKIDQIMLKKDIQQTRQNTDISKKEKNKTNAKKTVKIGAQNTTTTKGKLIDHSTSGKDSMSLDNSRDNHHRHVNQEGIDFENDHQEIYRLTNSEDNDPPTNSNRFYGTQNKQKLLSVDIDMFEREDNRDYNGSSSISNYYQNDRNNSGLNLQQQSYRFKEQKVHPVAGSNQMKSLQYDNNHLMTPIFSSGKYAQNNYNSQVIQKHQTIQEKVSQINYQEQLNSSTVNYNQNDTADDDLVIKSKKSTDPINETTLNKNTNNHDSMNDFLNTELIMKTQEISDPINKIMIRPKENFKELQKRRKQRQYQDNHLGGGHEKLRNVQETKNKHDQDNQDQGLKKQKAGIAQSNMKSGKDMRDQAAQKLDNPAYDVKRSESSKSMSPIKSRKLKTIGSKLLDLDLDLDYQELNQESNLNSARNDDDKKIAFDKDDNQSQLSSNEGDEDKPVQDSFLDQDRDNSHQEIQNDSDQLKIQIQQNSQDGLQFQDSQVSSRDQQQQNLFKSPQDM